MSGCGELGNPSFLLGQTGDTDWTDGVVATRTRTLSVAPSRDQSLPGRTGDGQLEHVDPTAPATGVATLVTVRATFGERPPPTQVQLTSELTLPDGRVVGRTWTAAGAAATWDAVFGLPAPPVAATTRIIAMR
jgi:hypothetical protein